MTKRVIRVLLIDDVNDEFVLLQNSMSQISADGYSIEWAGTYEDGLTSLRSGAHDVALVDYRLGPRDGLDLMREAKRMGCQIPMIFLTSMGRHEVDLEAMEAGAVDYLAKDKAVPEALERSIRYAVERKTLESMVLQSEKLSAMGQLAAGLAHEINNPLMLILGNVKMLQEAEPSDPRLAEALKMMDRAGERCRDLVRELLAFSRKEESRAQEFDLAEAIASALSLVATRAKIQSITIEHERPRIPLKVLGHKNHIEQVVINLCNNALDAMPGGGRLSLHLGRTNRSQMDFAQLTVSDTGPGIPEKLLGRLFEPFFTTKPADKGTGLGLTIVDKLVRQHGGEISVRSTERMGTAFTVTLPLAERKTARSPKNATQGPSR